MDAEIAVHVGLMALVKAYKIRVAGALNMPSDEQLLNFILQQVKNEHSRKSLTISLDDIPGLVPLKPSVLVELLHVALKKKQTELQLKNSKIEADTAWNGIHEASRIMRDSRLGTPAQRQTQAMKRLGLIRESHGKGRINPQYEEAAERYHLLRTGGYTHINGVLTAVEKKTHAEAIAIICNEFHIEWESLVRMWRRYGIQVSTKAEVFD